MAIGNKTNTVINVAQKVYLQLKVDNVTSFLLILQSEED